MKKIVINSCYGGFSLSDFCLQLLRERKNDPDLNEWYLARDDHDLVAIVEQYQKESWGRFAQLKIVNIPEDVEWTITEYDGKEHVAEVHRTWC